MSVTQKRRFNALVVVVGLFVGLMAVAGVSRVSEERAAAALSAKHTICHRTASTTNPYRRITVSINAIYNGNSGGFKSAKHPIHNDYLFKTYDSNNNGILSGSELTALSAVHSFDNTFFGFPGSRITLTNNVVTAVTLVNFGGNSEPTTDNVFRAGVNYPAPQKKWGDIIPPYQASWDRLNWGSEGQDIFNGVVAGCGRMTTLQFIQSEVAAGRTLSQIADDLDDQGASEDLALRQALGGSFVTWVNNNPGATTTTFQNAITAANPAVTTLAAGSVLTTSAQLRATVAPRGVNSTYFFQLATSSAGVASAPRDNTGMKLDGVNGTTSNSLTNVSATLDKSGLTNGTTYYYRIIGVSLIADPDSTNDTVESVVEGAIESFVMGSVSATTLPESNVGNTTATLNGNISPNTTATTLYFQYGTTLPLPAPALGDPSLINAGMNVGGSAGASSSSAATVLVDMPVAGLSQATTYYYRIVGLHSTNQFVIGELEEFTTTGGPTVSTGTASGVTASSATLGGTVTPNSIAVNIFFQWANSFGGVAGASELNSGMNVDGNPSTSSNIAGPVVVDLPITGLTASTTYYFRIVARNATNSNLVYQGSVATFSTPAAPNNNQNPNQGNNQVTPPSPPTTAKKQGPPAKVSNTGGNNGDNGNGDGGNGGPPVTDPRTGDSEPIENKVVVQVGPTLPTGGGGTGGGGGGSLRIAPQPNEPGLELLDANIEDPDYEIEVVRSGTDYNKPATWVADGFGDECWKIEPGDSSYVLPDPPVAPSGKPGATYSLVKVKAGSLTSDDPNFQVNTLFLDPEPATMVWPDSNKDGVFNPGGRTGDKEISHVILCVRFAGSSSTTTAAPGVTTTTAAPTTSSPNTTAAPTTAGPTTTAAPGATTTTAAPGATTTTAAPAIPTTSVPESTKEIEVVVRRVQSFSDGSTTTSSTSADGSRIRKIRLKVTNGFKESTLELEVDLARFALTGGNVPLPQLPKTGSSSNQPIQLALATIAFGAFLVVVRRRLRVV